MMSLSTGSYLQLQRGNQSSPNSLHCFGILSESEVSSPGNVWYWIFVKFIILMMYIIMLSSITSFKLFIPVYLNTSIIYVPLSKHIVTFSYVIFNFFIFLSAFFSFTIAFLLSKWKCPFLYVSIYSTCAYYPFTKAPSLYNVSLFYFPDFFSESRFLITCKDLELGSTSKREHKVCF